MCYVESLIDGFLFTKLTRPCSVFSFTLSSVLLSMTPTPFPPTLVFGAVRSFGVQMTG